MSTSGFFRRDATTGRFIRDKTTGKFLRASGATDGCCCCSCDSSTQCGNCSGGTPTTYRLSMVFNGTVDPIPGHHLIFSCCAIGDGTYIAGDNALDTPADIEVLTQNSGTPCEWDGTYFDDPYVSVGLFTSAARCAASDIFGGWNAASFACKLTRTGPGAFRFVMTGTLSQAVFPHTALGPITVFDGTVTDVKCCEPFTINNSLSGCGLSGGAYSYEFFTSIAFAPC